MPEQKQKPERFEAGVKGYGLDELHHLVCTVAALETISAQLDYLIDMKEAHRD